MALPLSYNVRNVRARWQVSLLAMTGIALVVTVCVALMAMRAGFEDAQRVRGLDLGATIPIQRHGWKIVGLFASRGGAFESEVWGDLDTMAGPFRRQGGSNSLVVRLKDPSTLDALDHDIRADPDMQLQAVEERQYYEEQAGGLSPRWRAARLPITSALREA